MRAYLVSNSLTLNLLKMNIHKKAAGLVVFVLLLFIFACGGNNKKAQKQESAIMEVSIDGMTCLGCEQTIQKNITALEGIKSVKASFTTGNAIIEYFPAIIDTGKIKETVTGSGYLVKKFIIQPKEGNKN